MLLHVDILGAETKRPPAGALVRVQVRDTTLIDVESPLVAETTAVVEEQSAELGTVDLEVPESAVDPRGRLDLFVHVDINGDGTLRPGDLITTQSYPVPRGQSEARLEAAVQPI